MSRRLITESASFAVMGYSLRLQEYFKLLIVGRRDYEYDCLSYHSICSLIVEGNPNMIPLLSLEMTASHLPLVVES